MVPSIRDSNTSDYHASYSRAEDWNACCARAMGYEPDDWAVVDVLEEEEDGQQPTLQVTNLLPGELFEVDGDEDNENKPANDPWMETALNIETDLQRMAAWIQSKKWLFISFDSMEDAEASLIQSTVTSFAATTANEIESLRKLTLGSKSNNQTHHRTGIVQILLAKLKEEIVVPFGILQKHRSREAVRLWQNPLQCKLLVKRRAKAAKKRDELDQALGLDDQEDEIEKSRREQRFLPNRDVHQLRQNFMDTYKKDQHIPTAALKRPKSLIRDPMSALKSANESKEVFRSNSQDEDVQLPPPHNQQQVKPSLTGLADYQLEEMTEDQHQQMHQEAQMLQAMVHSDLDSVQKMETQMVSIATLLTQFSELVSEQQEEVVDIHDAAKQTKDNMDKGQETLVDAAERTHQSKHYMAKGIFALAWLLLFFHWLRP